MLSSGENEIGNLKTGIKCYPIINRHRTVLHRYSVILKSG